MHRGGESLDRMFFSFSYTLRTVRSALLGTSEVTISFTTMTKFLLTISMKFQADENKEKYQSRDWQLIQYWILHSNNMRTVSETVRRIADEILGVKGLSKLLESVMRLLLFSVILTANVNICLQLDCVELNIIGLWLKIKRWKGNLINKELLKTSRLVVLRKGSPKFSNFGGGEGKGGFNEWTRDLWKVLTFWTTNPLSWEGWVGGEGWNFQVLYNPSVFFFCIYA